MFVRGGFCGDNLIIFNFTPPSHDNPFYSSHENRITAKLNKNGQIVFNSQSWNSNIPSLDAMPVLWVSITPSLLALGEGWIPGDNVVLSLSAPSSSPPSVATFAPMFLQVYSSYGFIPPPSSYLRTCQSKISYKPIENVCQSYRSKKEREFRKLW